MTKNICPEIQANYESVERAINELNQDISVLGPSGGNLIPLLDKQDAIVHQANASNILKGCGFIFEINRGVLSGHCPKDDCPITNL